MMGKLKATEYARTNKVPFFGICLGLQISILEFARNVVKIPDANSTEFDNKTKDPVIGLVAEWDGESGVTEVRDYNCPKGGTMRLGAQKCRLDENSKVAKLYQTSIISERHRHRYEVNGTYADKFEAAGLQIVGKSVDRGLVEIVELKGHPWYIGCQFHPEFTSRPMTGHPLFNDFVRASLENK